MIPSYVIDPGGIPGFKLPTNVLLRPNSNPTYRSQSTENLTTYGSIYLAGVDRIIIDIPAFLTETDFYKLRALDTYISNAKENNTPYEIVVYDLYMPYTEESVERSRYAVPDTSIVEIPLDGLSRYVYYTALQGVINIKKDTIRRVGSHYFFTLVFTEGTILYASNEP